MKLDKYQSMNLKAQFQRGIQLIVLTLNILH